MATLAQSGPLDSPASAPASLRRWSRDDYYAMAQLGIIQPDERVELLDGQVIALSPINPPHRKVMIRLYDLLRDAFGEEAYVMPESPVTLGDQSEPQPDIAVAVGPEAAYDHRHPNPADLLLVVEIADSSLRRDRTAKRAAYAAAGICEYWIADLASGTLDVFRSPAGGKYTDVRTYTSAEVVTPLRAPDRSIPVNAFLPAVAP